MAALLLEYCKGVDRRIWPHQHPLRQFEAVLSGEVLFKLEQKGAELERLVDMEEREIGAMIRHPHGGKVGVGRVGWGLGVESWVRRQSIICSSKDVTITFHA